VTGRTPSAGTAARLRRYLHSRKHLAGMVGALSGVGLHLAGLVGEVWPAVAIGLYAVGALVAPPDPVEEPIAAPRLTDVLRAEAEAQLTRVELRRAELPAGAERAVRRIVRTVRWVLDRLDEPAERDADRVAALERLADVTEIVRADLTESLDTWFGRTPSAVDEVAARELHAQLEMTGARADRLAEQFWTSGS
jgi:hypothetical protein